MKLFKISTYFISAIIMFINCGSSNGNGQSTVSIDTSITEETSYNNMFLDSVAVDAFVNNDTSYKPFRKQFMDFYRHRNFEFAWFDTTGLTEQARNFINSLNTDTNMNDTLSVYDRLKKMTDRFRQGITGIRHAEMVHTELTLTGAFFKHAQNIFGGNNLDAEALGWFIPRKKIDFSAMLDSTLVGRGKSETDLLNPQFKQLQDILQKYIDLKRNSHWNDIVLSKSMLHLRDKGEDVAKIQHRLYLLGDMDDDEHNGRFDKETLSAVKSFQRRNGLNPDGVIGAGFMNALNTPLDSIIKTITVNMERMRWIPADLPPDYVWVNIPDYKLQAFQNDTEVFNMRVIVGSAANATTIFSGNIKYIVFAPYWNVPESIVKKEIMPGIKNNPSYIADHNMQVTGYEKGIPQVRQLPGPNNSLGRVKFLFPNNFNIYLHDTPNHDLFDSRDRGLSHGCIRLSNPTLMANWLLRDDTVRYPRTKIDSLMNKNKKETWVTLDKGNTMPVYLVYFTAWVDNKGMLNLRKDIYGHDAKIADKLFVR